MADEAAFSPLRIKLHTLRGAAASIGAMRLCSTIEAVEAVGDDTAGMTTALAYFANAAAVTLAELKARKAPRLQKRG